MAKSTVSPTIKGVRSEKSLIDEKWFFLLALQSVCSIRWRRCNTVFWIIFLLSNLGSVLLVLLHLPTQSAFTNLFDTTSNFVFSTAVVSLISSAFIILLRKNIVQQLMVDPYDFRSSQGTRSKVVFTSLPVCCLILALYSTIFEVILSPQTRIVYSILHSVIFFITNLKLYLNSVFYLVVIYQLSKSTVCLKNKILLFTGGPLEEISIFQLQRIDRCLELLEQIQNVFIFLMTVTTIYFISAVFQFNEMNFLLLTLPYIFMTLFITLANCHLNNLVSSFKRGVYRLFDLQGIVNNSSVLIGYFTFLSRSNLMSNSSCSKLFVISTTNVTYIMIISICYVLRITNFA